MDIFSFGVLILQTFVRADVAEAHMFAHSDLVMERTIADGSFESVILVTDKLRPDVLHQNMVCDLLRRCLSPTGTSRPTMKQVVQDLSFLCKKSE
ncbi:unnamed protein product [Ascophyllum nodosum]